MKSLPYIVLLSLFLTIGNAHIQAQKKSKKEEISYKDKKKFERLFIDASKAKILGDLEQSIKLYEACKKIDPSQPAPYYELGNLYMNFNEFDEAAENARQASLLEPKNYYYRLLYAEILKNNQDYDRAQEEYENIAKDFPQKVNSYLELSLIFILKKDYSSAIEVYDELEKQIGPNEEVKLKKQYLYLQKGDVNKAAKEIEDLIKLDPENVQYYLLLAEIYNVNGMDGKALGVYQKAADRFPGDASINLSLAEFYRSKGQIQKALGYLKIAFADATLNIDEKVKTILSFFDLAEREAAYQQDLKDLGEILLIAHPKDARVLTINGDINLNFGEKKKALKFFIKALEVDDSRFPIWSQVLLLEADLEMFDTLSMHCKQAIEIFPNQPGPYYFLGYAKTSLKEYEESAEAYRQGVNLVIENPPLKVQFYLGMAEAYNEIKRFDLSDESFEKILAVDSNNTIALNNYSYYLSVRGDKLEKALRLSKRANTLEPNSATYLDTYAWILYKLERYEEAKEWMAKAIQYGGEKSGEVLEHMGDILMKLNEPEEALNYYKKALLVGGGSAEIQKKIDEISKEN